MLKVPKRPVLGVETIRLSPTGHLEKAVNCPQCQVDGSIDLPRAAMRHFRKVRRLVQRKDHPYSACMITSKLTSKAQTTIPQPVRAALRLREGDEIAYVIEPGRVLLTRAQPHNASDDPFRTFAEWDNPADTEAYARL